jgi:hypothetical protein
LNRWIASKKKIESLNRKWTVGIQNSVKPRALFTVGNLNPHYNIFLVYNEA